MNQEPAFPVQDLGKYQCHGMSLRDYFAGKAMNGFNKGMVDYGWDEEILMGHAKQAYAIADAMLEARKV